MSHTGSSCKLWHSFTGWFLWENGNNIFSLAVTLGSTVQFAASSSGMVEQSKCPNVARCTCCSVVPARWNWNLRFLSWIILGNSGSRHKPIPKKGSLVEPSIPNYNKFCIIIPHEGHLFLKPPTSKKTIVAQRTSNSEVDDKSIHKPNWPHGHSKQMISNQQTMPCQHDSLCMVAWMVWDLAWRLYLKLTISKETSSRVKFLFDICWHLGCTK